MRFDLLIKGGEVVDPGAGYSGKMDIAVTRNRIAAVEPHIPAESAFRVVDATGEYVTPGLIDMHAHVYEGFGYWGVNADAIGSRSGVTTWADAGSTGAVVLQGFRDHIINRSKVKIYAFVNIAYTGLIGQDYELSVNEYCNVEALKLVANQNRDIIVGIKIRAGISGGAKNLVPFQRARHAADELELPIMVHLSTAPPDLETVLGFLKPGDIITHCYTGQDMRLVDPDKNLRRAAKKVLDEGVILDLGHGAASLSFDSAEALIKQGVWPHVVSTDLHHLSIVGPNLVLDDPSKGHVFGDRSMVHDAGSIVVRVRGGKWEPVFNLLTCIDKMLFLGMSFPEIVRATTAHPAEIMRLKGEVGTLKPGARADIAGFVIDKADVELRDIHGQVRRGKQKIRNTFTILEGRSFEPIEIPGPPPWIRIVNGD